MEVLIVVWVIGAIAIGYAANARGRDSAGWFVLALLISPIFAVLLLIAYPARQHRGPLKACRFCLSQIPQQAVVCAHCQREVATAEDLRLAHNAEAMRGRRQAWFVIALVGAFIITALVMGGK